MIRGVTSRFTVKFVYEIEEPPVVFAVPAVVFTTGKRRPTSMEDFWLSSVTVRGSEITRVSSELFRNDNTTLNPSAFKKAVCGLSPFVS